MTSQPLLEGNWITIKSWLRQSLGQWTDDATVETVCDDLVLGSEAVQRTAKQVADRVRAGYAEAERAVRDRPGESLLMCFGVGLIAGAVLALAARSPRRRLATGQVDVPRDAAHE